MDWSQLTLVTAIVLLLVLFAEAANGWTDAPTATSSAVASGNMKPLAALILAALSNAVGLVLAYFVGAKVATTVGTGIVRPEVITVASIGIAMVVSVAWSLVALRFRFAVSKSHTLFASLAGIGYAQGGFAALLPAPGAESGWISIGKGVIYAVVICFLMSWLISWLIAKAKLDINLSETFWKWAQRITVVAVGTGHGFGDGLKYVGIFALVLYKAEMIPSFQVTFEIICLCAIVMGVSTLLAGWRIHESLDRMVNGHSPVQSQIQKKSYRPYMGVSSELVSSFAIWQSGWLGIPMSTNHSVVSSMAGARSASGKVHTATTFKIIVGWVMTYGACFETANLLTQVILG